MVKKRILEKEKVVWNIQTTFYWWTWVDLNRRPRDYESPALTAELQVLNV